MLLGQRFNMICPYCKKDKIFTVTERRGPNRWEGQAPSCVQNGYMMVIVNDVGKQEWTLGPGSAYIFGRDCKRHQPWLGLKQAIKWLHEATSMKPTKQNIKDFTAGWRG